MLKPNGLTGADIRTYNGLTWTVQGKSGIIVNGTTTSYGDSKIVDLTGKLKKGVTYSFYLKEDSQNIHCGFVTKTAWNVPEEEPYRISYGSTYIATGEEAVVYCYAYVPPDNVTISNERIYPMLEAGDRKGFEPYFISSDTIKSVAEDETLTAVWGENLVNNKDFLGGNSTYENQGVTYTYQSDGSIKAEGTANPRYANSQLIYIENIINSDMSYVFFIDSISIANGCRLTMTDGTTRYVDNSIKIWQSQDKNYRASFIYGNIESGYIYLTVGPGVTINETFYPALVVF